MRHRLRRTLRRQPEDPHGQETGGQQRPGLREPCGGQADGQDRPEDEARLVDDRLPRIRRVQLARGALVELRPARPDHRADARHTPRTGREGEQQPVRPALLRAQQQTGDRGDRHQGGGAQHPALPVPVHQPGDLRAQDRGGQREGRGQRAGQAVAAGQLGDHRDDADAHHRQGHPAQQSGGRERLGAGAAEDGAVGTGQRGCSAGEDRKDR